MKITGRIIWFCLAAGFGLGLAGLLLAALAPGQDHDPACLPGVSTGPECGSPRVVRYTLEGAAPTRPAAAEAQAGFPRPGVEAAWSDEPIRPLMPVTPIAGPGLITRLSRPDGDPAGAGLQVKTRALAGLYPEAGQKTATPAVPESASSTGDTVTRETPTEPAPATPGRRAKAEEAKAVVAVEAPEPAVEAAAVPRPASPCPAGSGAQFDLIPVEGPAADHPDSLHGDLSLGLRGYAPVVDLLELVDYNGPADPGAPQLSGLFGGRSIQMTSAYRANQWVWDAGQCNGQARGCVGPVIEDWPVTALGLAVTPGEPVYPPRRGPEIYGGGYVALVLYAEATRLTLGYTRRDSVAAGYVIHLDQLCVDPNLLALYRAQIGPEGWRGSGSLPAVRNQQAVGQALGGELVVAVRDAGNFLDPRSRKDWWQGQ